ncbi:CDP-glycerol poly(glycerophosphate) glycerophosphotransferase [Levilactobacillus koreensis JCM 16448]|uniref:CDP-glycerol--glycerophosphate glycerophosphotransferase n=1 Tax=Levilactobacillus koreensis TaxID=637971 RepID=A0AAC8UWS3_9LACO|nr:CDP-glycerol glycerophosphotransferase family protein [Levilactobacillus koreensis]AKP65342.1 hypothetical protein ABN16_10230 [Levilactobacillus koreensis]KRK86071.1 CDP-glycerol poly(glycerophosphate) glycerophosphotransferase [Levilactobacillus koreensis JCM 16448]
MKELIKNSFFLGKSYLIFMLVLYKVADFITRTDAKMILFCSFSGRQFSDSPREIYDSLKNDKRFKDYKLVWVFNDPSKFKTEYSVKMGSWSYYKALFRSKFWVSNASIERLVPYKGKHVYINTWHGVPLKHLGPDEGNLPFLVSNWYSKVEFDLLTACGSYDFEIFKKIFPRSKSIKKVGLARNEPLINSELIRKKSGFQTYFDLDKSKQTILYAPTFREYDLEGKGFSANDMLSSLSVKYNVLFRGHYFSKLNIANDVIDVSDYSDLNDLLLNVDILITDYSSILFDFSLLEKPIFLYLYDWDKYKKYRGFYLAPTKLGIPYAFHSQDLVDMLNQKMDVSIIGVKQINVKFHEKNNAIETITEFIE